MPRDLAVVTGASSGIGAVFARRLARDYDLLLVARRRDRLESLATELSASGSAVECMEADLATEAATAALADRLRSDARLALLVNNAGFGTRGLFWKSPLEEQEKMHRLHVMATVRLSHAALAAMVERNRGAIINVASVAAYVRNAGSASYCATKSWMKDFTEALHLELRAAGSHVRVQALCPGYTYSEFHEALGVSRDELAAGWLWLTAERVVDASLDGLKTGKVFVIPGALYRTLACVLPKLPSGFRLFVEGLSSAARRRQYTNRPPGR